MLASARSAPLARAMRPALQHVSRQTQRRSTCPCFAIAVPATAVRHLSASAWRTRASAVEGGTRQQGNVSESASTSSSSSSQELPIVNVDSRQGKVGVTWSSGIESRYHNVWLRDHCRCAECYHPQTKQRQVDTFAIPLDIQPQAVEATTEGLLVHWPKLGADAQVAAAMAAAPSAEPTDGQGSAADSHASLYPWSWLYNNSYAPSPSLGSAEQGTGNVIMWGAGIAQQPPTVTWEEVMSEESERGVARWLNKVSQFGFCFVSGVPATPEDTERLVRRIAFIRETHYGGFWDFTSDLSHGDTAYTNLRLGAHTDTTYFTDPAGLQLFHLLSHTEAAKDQTPARGGESLLVDGFFAAKILREVYPDAYRVLSSARVPTHSAGDDMTLIRPLQSAGYPILEHDELTGELIRVRYNNDDRSVVQMRDEDVLPFYDALNKWHGILTHSDSEYWSQLTPGTALIFDNNRVLHGRSAFTGNRRLCGAYVNHDDYRSRLAVLQKQFPELDSGVRRGAANVVSSNTSGGNSSATSAYSGGKTAQTGGGPGAPGAKVARRGVWDDGI